MGEYLTGSRRYLMAALACLPLITACQDRGAGTVLGPLMVGVGMDVFGPDKMALIIFLFYAVYLPMPLVSYLRRRSRQVIE